MKKNFILLSHTLLWVMLIGSQWNTISFFFEKLNFDGSKMDMVTGLLSVGYPLLFYVGYFSALPLLRKDGCY